MASLERLLHLRWSALESIVNAWKPLTVVTKSFILNDTGVVGLHLKIVFSCSKKSVQSY